MRNVFKGLSLPTGDVEPGCVVMWSSKGRLCYGLKLKPHATAKHAGGFQENIVLLSPAELPSGTKAESGIGQLIWRDLRRRVLTVPNAAILPVLAEGTVELEIAGNSQPGELEIWDEKICLRAGTNVERENPLIELTTGEILVGHELPPRNESSYPTIVRAWELVRTLEEAVETKILGTYSPGVKGFFA